MAKGKLKNKLKARQEAVNHIDHKQHSQKIGEETRDSLIKQSHSDESHEPRRNNDKPLTSSTHKTAPKVIKEQNDELKQRREAEYEADLDERPVKFERYQKNRNKQRKIIKRVISIVLIVLSVYFAFLIYGIATTNYTYNSNNEIEPIRVSYNDIKELKAYRTITTHYFACRDLYEKVLLLDCRYSIAETHEDFVQIANDYWKLLDLMETLDVQINGLDLPSEYDNVKQQLHLWIVEYIKVYCEAMSYSITNNSQDDLALALEREPLVYNGFSIITANIASMGANITGAESIVNDIDSWSPETFVQEQGFINYGKENGK